MTSDLENSRKGNPFNIFSRRESGFVTQGSSFAECDRLPQSDNMSYYRSNSFKQTFEAIAGTPVAASIPRLRIANIMSESRASWWKRAGRFLAVLCWLPFVPLVVVSVIGFRSAKIERRQVLQTSVAEQRTRLIRVATQIEMAIESNGLSPDWEPLKTDPRVRTKWFPTLWRSDQQLYAAIVDPVGQIIVHSDPDSEGRPIGIAWYDQVVPVDGLSVVKVKAGPLSQGQLAYDVRVPILQNDHIIGELHAGLPADKLDVLQSQAYQTELKRYFLPALATAGIALLAGIALIQLASANEKCYRLASVAKAKHSRELEQIAGGMAHEIRNPLHAIRMNLHVLNRWYSRKSELSQEDLESTLSSSSSEVDRVEQIIRDLLRYAIPHSGTPAPLNLVTELQATVNLMREDLKHKEIVLSISDSPPDTWVNVDSSVFRQLMIDLLTFAQNNAGSRGRIDVTVAHQGSDCELEIADQGATLSDSQRGQMFEPFQSPQKTGSSLGLAQVKSSVEQAGGSIECVSRDPQGNRIQVRFPRQTPPLAVGAS